MKFLCDNCEKYPCDDNAIKLMKYCPVYSPKPKPQTNADHIRSMTDEEIADFLCDIGECDRRCPAKIGDCIFSDSTCRQAWLEWLKGEARHDRT